MIVETAVVPVAGLATRMQPLSRAVPKELLPLGDRPVLHWVVEELVAAGVRHIVMITSSRTEAVERYFSDDPVLDERLAGSEAAFPDGALWQTIRDCDFSFVRHGRARGIADAVMRGRHAAGTGPFYVHMGDSIMWQDNGLLARMAEHHEAEDATCTAAVTWRPAFEKSHRAVAIAVEQDVAETDAYFLARRLDEQPVGDMGQRAALVGRYLFSRAMVNTQSDPMTDEGVFGSMTGVFADASEESERIVAVALQGSERILGAGSLQEYRASQAFLIRAGEER